jgi:hypothetical protein
VPGNHFFFLGEKGARATAEAISILHNEAGKLKNKLGVLLGIKVL